MDKLYKAIIFFLRRAGLFCPCQIPGSHYNCAFHLQGGHSERLPHVGLRPPGEERGQTCDRDCGLCSGCSGEQKIDRIEAIATVHFVGRRKQGKFDNITIII